MGMALFGHDSNTLRPNSRGEFTARYLAEICAQSGPNRRIRLSSAGPGYETSLPEGRATPDDGGAKHSQDLETPRSIYHALIGLAIIVSA